jgi:hypothetical protein
MKTLTPKKIEVFFSSLGRKNRYIAIKSGKSVYPVIYFTKSKFATDDEYIILLEEIERLFKENSNE